MKTRSEKCARDYASAIEDAENGWMTVVEAAARLPRPARTDRMGEGRASRTPQPARAVPARGGWKRRAAAAVGVACAMTGCTLGSPDPAAECRAAESRITSRLEAIAAESLEGVDHSTAVTTSSCDTGIPGPVLRVMVSQWQSRRPAFAYFAAHGWVREGASTTASPQGFVAHLNPHRTVPAGAAELEVGFAMRG